MDEILFKGIKKDKQKKQKQYYTIKNKPSDYRISSKFKKDFQNIIYYFLKNKLDVIICNYYSNTRFEDVKVILDGFKYQYEVFNDYIKYEDRCIKFFNDKISDENRSCENLNDDTKNIYKTENISSKNDKKLKEDFETIIITFIYRYTTINGTSQKLKHLLLDQLAIHNAIIYCKDKQLLEEKYPDYTFVDKIDTQLKCDKLIFYDIPENFFDLLGYLEWRNGIEVVCIYVNEQEVEKINFY